MRWDNLFDDLEGQLELEKDAATDLQALDEERQRQAALTLHERLRNLTPTRARDQPQSNGGDPAALLRLTMTSGLELSLVPLRHGRNWCSIDVISPGALAGQAILALSAIAYLSLTPDQVTRSMGVGAAPETPALPPKLADRIGLGFILRDLARRRRAVEIHALQGVYRGTLDRVAADHCDIAEHALHEPRRNENVRVCTVLALSQILLVRVL